MADARWRSVSDFLSDMPRFHCSVKPAHSFCTVCVRINPTVSADCPLRFEDLKSAPARSPPPRPASEYYSSEPEGAQADYEPARYERVSAAAVLPDAPVIEFARSTEPHQPRKRMKARAVQKRPMGDGEGAGEGGEAPQRRREADGRVWATHEAPEGGGPSDEDSPSPNTPRPVRRPKPGDDGESF